MGGLWRPKNDDDPSGFLKMKGNAAAQPIIGHDLQRGVINRYRKIDIDFSAPLSPGCYDPWTEEVRGNAGILGRFAAKPVDVLVFAGNCQLKPNNDVALADKIITRPSTPGQIIGKMILVRAIATECELNVRFKKKIPVTKRIEFTKNSVERTGHEGEIVPMNPARRSARNFHVVKFFLQSAGVTGRKLDSAQENRRKREIGFVFDRDRIFAFKFKGPARRRSVMEQHAFE